MKYFSQTGDTIFSTKQNQSTSQSQNVDKMVKFEVVENSRFFNDKTVSKKVDNQPKEELTQEEEDRFYKKVFKTKLI